MTRAFCTLLCLAALSVSGCAGSKPGLADGLPDIIETDGRLYELRYFERDRRACVSYQQVRQRSFERTRNDTGQREIGSRSKTCGRNFDEAFDHFREETARGLRGNF